MGLLSLLKFRRSWKERGQGQRVLTCKQGPQWLLLREITRLHSASTLKPFQNYCTWSVCLGFASLEMKKQKANLP